MSRHSSDSFLPSGAVPSPPTFSPGSLASPSSVPRSMPSQGSRTSLNSKPYLQTSRDHSRQGRPISPPKTRSASADDSSAALVEDWRLYTSKLRSQNEGERAHMAADRARMEEVMAEERALWDKERDILKARIVELELELEKKGGVGSHLSPPVALRERPGIGPVQHGAMSFTSPGSNAVSVTGSFEAGSSRSVPQESGRNADGSPFYAPAPRNPSRTFEPPEITALRVDTLSTARESPIRVTSKELTPSDFGVHSPPTNMSELETIPETQPESIDISHIRPDLEGVPIRASAVSPAFAAKVLSPQNFSPVKLSPNLKPPNRPSDGTLSPLNRGSPPENTTRSPEKVDVVAVMLQPENRRLTMHAGHTPNHSISKIEFSNESGSATPTQVNTESNAQAHVHLHHTSLAHLDGQDSEGNGDKELTSPLGLMNEAARDDPFLAALVEKLEEAKKSEGVSPSSESTSSRFSDEGPNGLRVQEEEEKDLPPLRLKPSVNFGRPMGSL